MAISLGRSQERWGRIVKAAERVGLWLICLVGIIVIAFVKNRIIFG